MELLVKDCVEVFGPALGHVFHGKIWKIGLTRLVDYFRVAQ